MSDARPPQAASEELRNLVKQCMSRKSHGKLYSRPPHPDFADWPSSRSVEERPSIIEPHLTHKGGTALDIGALFGNFCHWLEDLGYTVTAVEHSPLYAEIMRQVRDLRGKKFNVFEGSFYDLKDTDYDVVLALNIFHHSLKTQERYERLTEFLSRLKCRMMIFEAHDEAEKQMANAYKKMKPQEAAEFVAAQVGLTRVEQIGTERGRRIYKLH